jgi:hypothetical protein
MIDLSHPPNRQAQSIRSKFDEESQGGVVAFPFTSIEQPEIAAQQKSRSVERLGYSLETEIIVWADFLT